MAKLGTAWVNIRVNLKPLKTGLKLARTAVRSAMRGISKVVRKAMHLAKRAIQALSAIAIASIWAFVRFEKQLANVATMLDKHTMDFMPKYGEELKRLAVTFGESTATLSTGLYDILSASIAPAKALDVLTVAVKAAKAGMTDTRTAADAITTVLNSYQMSADEAGKVSDILFAIVKRGKTTFAELAQSIGRVAATANVAGVSFEELGAALATMTRAGLRADIAVSSLRGLLNAFLKPQKDSIEMAEKFGFELNTTTLKAIGLTGVLKKLKGATGEQLAVLIPNVRGMAGFAASLAQAEKQASDLRLMLNSAGLTQEAFDKMTKILSFDLAQLRQAFVVLGDVIGGTLGPAVRLLSEYIKVLLKRFGGFYKDNEGAVEDWAVTVIGKLILVSEAVQVWVINNKGQLLDWIATVRDAFSEAVQWFKDLLALIQDKGWEAGLNKIGVDIEKALLIAVERISPHAEEIGRQMAQGFKKGMRAAGRGISSALAATTVGAIAPEGSYIPKGSISTPATSSISDWWKEQKKNSDYNRWKREKAGLPSKIEESNKNIVRVWLEMRDSARRLEAIQQRHLDATREGNRVDSIR